jgi:glycosyltransferase involved in cell wall biosynthesis
MSERPLSIVHVIASLAPRYGGPAKVAELCEALAARGHRVEIATTNIDGPFDLDVPIGVPVEHRGCAVTYFQVRRPRTPATAPRLVPWLRANLRRFDVMHVHGLYLFPTLVSAFTARHAHVPYIHQPHGALTAYHRAHHPGRKTVYEALFERRNLRCAAAVRYDSQCERDEALARNFPRGVVIPPGTPTPRPGSRAERVPGRIVFLGRLSAKKGVDVLLEALPLVIRAVPTAHLVVAGPDEEGIGEKVRERARALGVAERVTLRGLVEDQQKVDLLRTAGVLAAPSIAESFGATVTEAMAVETPVVVTRGIPIHAQIDRESAGLVVDRTPRTIADGIERILGDETFAAKLGLNGRVLVEAEYSWGEVSRRVEELYRDAIGRPLPIPASHGRVAAMNGLGAKCE